MAQLTADTITDSDLRRLRDALPSDHHGRAWCETAITSTDSLAGQLARGYCAELINARAAGKE